MNYLLYNLLQDLEISACIVRDITATIVFRLIHNQYMAWHSNMLQPNEFRLDPSDKNRYSHIMNLDLKLVINFDETLS